MPRTKIARDTHYVAYLLKFLTFRLLSFACTGHVFAIPKLGKTALIYATEKKHSDAAALLR
jgi:hypothetical protein